MADYAATGLPPAYLPKETAAARTVALDDEADDQTTNATPPEEDLP